MGSTRSPKEHAVSRLTPKRKSLSRRILHANSKWKIFLVALLVVTPVLGGISPPLKKLEQETQAAHSERRRLVGAKAAGIEVEVIEPTTCKDPEVAQVAKKVQDKSQPTDKSHQKKKESKKSF